MSKLPSLPSGSLCSLPLGTRIPLSVHAVTCSLPTMRDVIGYEEKDPETLNEMPTGYPRFVTHFYIRKIADHWKKRFGLAGRELIFSTSPTILREAQQQAADPEAAIIESDGLAALHFSESSPGFSRARSFIQHVGANISSRLAENYLLEHGLLSEAQKEERESPDIAETKVRSKIGNLFGSAAEDVILANSGMNAVYSVFRKLDAIKQEKGRKIWIQLGWLYLDTIEILTKLTAGNRVYFPDVLDLDRLEKFLNENGHRVAGVVTEAPTNPLLETPDLPRLRKLTAQHDVPLIIDPTLATPHNIDVLPWCDVAVNSLTKYAANQGDVMLGAAILNRDSKWADQLNLQKSEWLVPPYRADLERLAAEIDDYETVVDAINSNALKLAAFLRKHPAVKEVFTPYSGEVGKNYRAIERRPNSPGAMISITIKRPIAEFYDRIEVPKGPSFGALFTLLCPFLYLAHHDLVTTEAGRQKLAESGIDTELIRISVGTENSDAIISAFHTALG